MHISPATQARAKLEKTMMKNHEDKIIELALNILRDRLRNPGAALTSPQTARQFLILELAGLEHEVFGVFFLDNQHRVIKFEELFQGTIDSASVYPREVVKAALLSNAAAVIFTHNHPSGVADPSDADRRITERLVAALELTEVRVLDHIIVGGDDTYSFAEHGLL